MSTRRQHGLTLIELIVFIVIVSIAMMSIVQVMNQTAIGSVDPLRRKQALQLAESLLEEVALGRFTFCEPSDSAASTATSTAGCTVAEGFGPIAGETRPYDNVMDYVTVSGAEQAAFNDGAGVLVDAAGNPIGLTGYSATLSIQPEALGSIASDAAVADMNVLRITVTVRYPDDHFLQLGTRDTVVLEGYRTRYAPN